MKGICSHSSVPVIYMMRGGTHDASSIASIEIVADLKCWNVVSMIAFACHHSQEQIRSDNGVTDCEARIFRFSLQFDEYLSNEFR